MILIALISLSVVTAGVLMVMAQMKMRFALIWATAFASVLVTWSGILALAWRIPRMLTWEAWHEMTGLYGGPHWLVLDTISWPLAFSIASIGLAAVLTSLIRQPAVTPGNLAGILVLVSGGLASVTAGSISALVLAWMGLDLYELILQLSNTRDRSKSERVVISLSGHFIGTLLVLFAVAISRQADFDLLDIPVQVNVIFVLAAAFRLGVLPAQPPILPVLETKHGVQTMMRLAPAAGTMALLARSAVIGVPDHLTIPLMILVLMAGFYGAFYWIRSVNETMGRSYWIIAVASLAISAVLLQQPEAVIAFGIMLVSGGGLLFLRDKQGRRLTWLYLVALLMMIGAVFTPTWAVADMVFTRFLPWGMAVSVILIMLLVGYLRHVMAQQPEGTVNVVGVFTLYVGGLTLSLASMVFAGLLPYASGERLPGEWRFGVMIFLLSGLLVAARQRGLRLPTLKIPRLFRVLSLRMFYRVLWRGYRLSGRGVSFMTRILEGQSAVLWALLLLAFLVALFAQLGIGS